MNGVRVGNTDIRLSSAHSALEKSVSIFVEKHRSVFEEVTSRTIHVGKIPSAVYCELLVLNFVLVFLFLVFFFV